MVTLRREQKVDTKEKNNREYANTNRTHSASNNGRKASPEYLDYLWSELKRTEARKTMSAEEFFSKRQNAREKRSKISERINKEPNYGTRQYAYANSSASQSATKYSFKGKLDKKGVIAIVAYFLIVAVIATIIIATGNSSKAFSPKTGSQAEMIQTQGNEVNSTTEVPLVSEKMLDKAIDNGSVKNIQLLEKSNAYNYETKTNWFDKLCDKISVIVGG